MKKCMVMVVILLGRMDVGESMNERGDCDVKESRRSYVAKDAPWGSAEWR